MAQLTETHDTSASSVNVTTALGGTTFWRKWQSDFSERTKLTGSGISTFTQIGSFTLSGYTNDPRPISDNTGDGSTDFTSDAEGVYTGNVNNTGLGFQVDITATSGISTCDCYFGIFSSSAQAVLSLLDGSAGPVTVSFANPGSGVSGDANIHITFQGAGSTTLRIQWTSVTPTVAFANVTLNAIALKLVAGGGGGVTTLDDGYYRPPGRRIWAPRGGWVVPDIFPVPVRAMDDSRPARTRAAVSRARAVDPDGPILAPFGTFTDSTFQPPRPLSQPRRSDDQTVGKLTQGATWTEDEILRGMAVIPRPPARAADPSGAIPNTIRTMLDDQAPPPPPRPIARPAIAEATPATVPPGALFDQPPARAQRRQAIPARVDGELVTTPVVGGLPDLALARPQVLMRHATAEPWYLAPLTALLPWIGLDVAPLAARQRTVPHLADGELAAIATTTAAAGALPDPAPGRPSAVVVRRGATEPWFAPALTALLSTLGLDFAPRPAPRAPARPAPSDPLGAPALALAEDPRPLAARPGRLRAAETDLVGSPLVTTVTVLALADPPVARAPGIVGRRPAGEALTLDALPALSGPPPVDDPPVRWRPARRPPAEALTLGAAPPLPLIEDPAPPPRARGGARPPQEAISLRATFGAFLEDVVQRARAAPRSRPAGEASVGAPPPSPPIPASWLDSDRPPRPRAQPPRRVAPEGFLAALVSVTRVRVLAFLRSAPTRARSAKPGATDVKSGGGTST